MKTTRIETIQDVITILSCDFCDNTREYSMLRRTTKGVTISSCAVCKKDCCREHAKLFQESEYDEAVVCISCMPRFSEAWIEALVTANRYEYVSDKALEIINATRN